MASFPFLNLPLELRDQIYSLYFKPADRLVRNDALNAKGYFGGVYAFDFDLCRVNRQVYKEAKRVWERENVFVKIATPWPSAGMYRVYLMSEEGLVWDDEGMGMVNHITSEGLVPIVCSDRFADSFTTHASLVEITAPLHQAVPEHTVVVLLDDLHLFTQTWFYSALSYPMLNDRLATTFSLRNPSTPLALQEKLLLLFGEIKGLHHMEVTGYAPELKKKLTSLMAIPAPSVGTCCEEGAALMATGDASLAANNPQEALDTYLRAFAAIHILIHGRTRRVLADAFFHDAITSGRFAGQSGTSVRVVLRLQLVSRCVLAQLQLGHDADAAFWGMRTIHIMRDSLDVEFEDFLSDFIGGQDVAMIYLRTGVALWRLEQFYRSRGVDTGEFGDEKSERIWGLARKFLKGRKKADVRAELRELGVPMEIVGGFGDAEEGDGSTSAKAGSPREDFESE
ncbi:hypothetical protein DE146DRAFT_392249 [Phaeosphaeria sp. MPI-PUGE-AT-0046c]|nr:hypothetical protein DE146DRAFT_392249 [Phaeosphaeria sp. MPI-PUGE-AT-0046c]